MKTLESELSFFSEKDTITKAGEEHLLEKTGTGQKTLKDVKRHATQYVVIIGF